MNEPSPDKNRSFIGELAKRRVVQAALVYFAIAWTVTEVISFLLGAIPVFPAWSTTLVALLFVLGFPVAMFLAWRFDVGRGGLQRTGPGTRTGRLTIVASLVLLAVSTAGLFWLIYPHVEDARAVRVADDFSPPERSIAVMPFLDMSGEEGNDYLAIGVPDTVLHKIANLGDLVVIARTSSFAVGDHKTDAATVGRKLNVRYLLEGSVQSTGNEVRIIAQLINTADASHVWSLDRRVRIDDVFALQDEIALEIARALRLTLRDEERAQLLENGTSSVPAYLEYLRGNFAQSSRSLELLDDALRHYEAALDIDPNYARAHLGIARTYDWLGAFGGIDESEANRRVIEHINRAIEIDPDLGPAYALLAILGAKPGDHGTDRDLLQKAVDLNPNDPEVMRVQALRMCNQGPDDACEEKAGQLLQEAIRRDPDNAELYFILAFNRMSRGFPGDAGRYLNAALQRNPNMTSAYTRLARILYAVENESPRAVACLREAIRRDPTNFFPRIELAAVYVDLGLDDLAETELAGVDPPSGGFAAFKQEVYIGLHVYRGELEAALAKARSALFDFPVGARADMFGDLLVADAVRQGTLAELRASLEQLMAKKGGFDPDSPAVVTMEHMAIAPTLVKVYLASGDRMTADSLLDAYSAFLETRMFERQSERLPFASRLATISIWRGDIDAALDALDQIPDRFLLLGWYVKKDPDFEVLHGHPRFAALVERIDERLQGDREAILGAGDSLPACVRSP